MENVLRQPGLRAGGQPVIALVGFALAVMVAALLGSYATQLSVDSAWYRELAKPAFNPPSAVFPVVWTFLYAAMALAAWRVWRERGFDVAQVLFFTQLVLNAAWSFLFFGLRSPGLALIEIVFLWGAVLATMVAFFARDRLAGWLLMPYLAWVTFATVLTASIWRLNG